MTRLSIAGLARRVWRVLSLSAAAAGLVGCGSLAVEVQVLEPAVVQRVVDAELLRTLLPVVLGSTADSLDAQGKRLELAHREAYVSMGERYSAEADALPEPAKSALKQIASGLPNAFDNNLAIKRAHAGLRADLKAYAVDIKRLVGSHRVSVHPSDVDYHPVLQRLGIWQQRVTQFSETVTMDVRAASEPARRNLAAATGALPSTNAANAELLLKAVLGDARGQVAQLSIQNSPAAFAVANTDESNGWATRYNHVFSRSYGGASDVAIRLDPHTGNYMLKGLSFDPADVAAVASKVTTQALVLSAQLAGAPVKLGSTPAATTPGAALSNSSGALVDAQARLATDRARADARKAALLELAHVIVSEFAEVQQADSTRRAEAIKAIRDALEKRLTQIRPAAAQPQ